jgi:hypothetical protein
MRHRPYKHTSDEGTQVFNRPPFLNINSNPRTEELALQNSTLIPVSISLEKLTFPRNS